ncbi:MAG: FG-GAP-like repeat-containing protein [Pyrinomonadaceae bacterium]
MLALNSNSKSSLRYARGRKLVCAASVLLLFSASFAALHWHSLAAPASRSGEIRFPSARLSKQVSVRARAARDSRVSLGNGHSLLTAYQGPEEVQRALTDDQASPRSLASADFDEDGVPDLVSSYEYGGRGIIAINRGNADSIYPNAPEAKQRRANGTFTDAPFLSPAHVFEAAVSPDFLGAGDFDGDGHWDVLVAARGGSRLYLLPGDGTGSLGAPKDLSLEGSVTALAVGDINRRDGLPDILVGVDGASGNKIYSFEGPQGAFSATPESIAVPETVTSIAVGQLDFDFESDLAVACGHKLLLAHGRDRKLTFTDADRASVSPPNIDTREFSFAIRSISVGEFDGEGAADLAVLTDQGEVRLLSQPGISEPASASKASRLSISADGELLARVSAEADLLSAHVSTSSNNDLVVIDRATNRLSVVSRNASQQSDSGKVNTISVVSFAADSSPRAVIPMRLNSDALQDLVLLRDGIASLVVLESGAVQTAGPPTEGPNFVSFSNTNPITMPSGFASPPRAANTYPSTVTVSGVSGTIDKLRVRLNNVSMGSFAQDIDILLVGPTGQKMLLMSDVGTSCVISNANLTFDDGAALDLAGFNCGSGIYKPKDNPPADTFPAPAPAGPYQTTLASFNGTNPNGTWSLYMVDDSSSFGSGQTIAGGWTLFFGPDSPSTFIVNSTANTDDGQCTATVNGCTLKEAINAANDHLGTDNITFNIPGPGPYTIDGIIPSITEPVSIDATTQPGFAGTPIIQKQNGGFGLNGGGTLIRGFVINTNGGISIQQAGNNIIEGNYIGINVAGTAAQGSLSGNGVTIDTANNTIGGTAPQAKNVIANVTYGIQFSTFVDDPATTADDASNNLIEGNYIGLNAAGSAIIPISQAGISSRSVPGSSSNTIGGTTAGARNVISCGGSATGIDLVYSGSHDYLIQGNFIGTDATGAIRFSIDGFFPSGNNEGVHLEGTASANTIGGTTPAARNIISGNSNGLFFRDSGTSNNLVQGNFIGTDVTGTKSLTNTVGLRTIFDANGNTIGGAVSAARNILSGNVIVGIQFGEPTKGGAVNNVVQGNFIGTDVTGDAAIPNGRTSFFDTDAGIVVPANSRGDRIIQNRIAYNKGSGIRITNVSGNDTNSIEIEITDNLIYANEGLGIDLGNQDITPNDTLDVDDGPNRLQNFPVLTSSTPAAARDDDSAAGDREPTRPNIGAESLMINGTLNSTPNATFTVHWYFSGDAQCTKNESATRPLVTGKVPGVATDGNGNAQFTFPFDFPNGITGGVINCTATDALGNTSEFSACLQVPSAPPPPAVQLNASSYGVAEDAGSRTVTVTRTGNTSAAATVDYATSDSAGTSPCSQVGGVASARCDYETTVGTLRFASGETSKTINILIVNDAWAEGSETFNITLSNATGATLGAQSSAPIAINDNETTTGANPVLDANFFVLIHYLDFLNRAPDSSGQAFWANQINQCGNNPQCVEVARINVSAAFYLSIEFQQTGYYAIRIQRVAFGRKSKDATRMTYQQVLGAIQQIGDGVVVLAPGWEAKLEANKQSYAEQVVSSSQFISKYPTNLSASSYVDALITTAAVAVPSDERQAAITAFASGGTTGRAAALRAVADAKQLTESGTETGSNSAVNREFREAFVLMQYLGYLRRDPDQSGYDFWLGKLNEFGGNFVNAEMVKAFISADEYKHRFGP